MAKVSKWFALATAPQPLETHCTVPPYVGWHWETIVAKDPEWVLWLITESRVLLPSELEKALLAKIKTVIWEHAP